MAAGFLGWALDAFDFFVVVFLVDVLAEHFHVKKSAIIFSITLTLVFRPLGAVIFGILADRFGRRTPLMVNVIYFATIEVLCGFAPNFTVFLVLRALFGIGMGGEWGVGASLAMETAPKRWRGVLSGVLQSGYSVGYLLAAVASRFVLPSFGWQWMFWLGGAPALLALYIRSKVPESVAWEQQRMSSVGQIVRAVGKHFSLFASLAVLMTLMMFLSHGTQDLYPDFLKSARGFTANTVSEVAILYNTIAVLGSIVFGHLSQRIGRRRGMVCALLLCVLVMPLWAFGSTFSLLVLGACLMQAGVQGAWGVIPAQLNEVAPDGLRGLIPGLAYQLGILFAAPVNNIQYALRDMVGYSWALALFEGINISLLVLVLFFFVRENRAKDFVAAEV